ncbi:permease prefix domain 1-containing protein [Arthrobacter gengyunqii]|uniref:Permease prefix domain 1-containing protein n=1 Tax=Arthrobacter gengyunqii TaxID=2886940 RepID=A0A9X1S613_9MICC|nr:permease prefix domain 1-containing protein [Arthrobacter gengyunqii]MCC3268601.1 permease prefix domain 1-containing protein [Arthrobacter gengyunqii]UOY95989.1 permease prefix domain 1-containing protein [Arthrobacter gengyunqii]
MSTLTDRYVFAALAAIPEAQRSDIERELRTSIADAVEARTDAGQSPAEAERLVLTEFGDPVRLAASYTDRPLYLIGPDLFLDWWRLLKRVLAIVVPLAFVATVVFRMTTDPEDPTQAFGAALSNSLGAVVQVGFWLTLVFAVIQYNGTRRKDLGLAPWSPAALPSLPRQASVSLGDTIATVVLLAFFIGLLLWQKVGSLLFLDGEPVVVLQDSLWSFWLPSLIALLAAKAVFAVVLYVSGRWTYLFAAVNTALALLFTVPVLWLLATDRVFDLTILSADGRGQEASSWTVGITAATVLVIGVWEIADGFIKAFKASRAAPAVSVPVPSS